MPGPPIKSGDDPGIHSAAFASASTETEWIAGSSPAMTTEYGLHDSRHYSSACTGTSISPRLRKSASGTGTRPRKLR